MHPAALIPIVFRAVSAPVTQAAQSPELGDPGLPERIFMPDDQPHKPNREFSSEPVNGNSSAPAESSALDIVALVLAFLIPPAGLITGIMAFRQSRARIGKATGLAFAATIVGGALTLLSVVGLIVALIAIQSSADQAKTAEREATFCSEISSNSDTFAAIGTINQEWVQSTAITTAGERVWFAYESNSQEVSTLQGEVAPLTKLEVLVGRIQDSYVPEPLVPDANALNEDGLSSITGFDRLSASITNLETTNRYSLSFASASIALKAAAADSSTFYKSAVSYCNTR
jgi:hypothetical protein